MEENTNVTNAPAEQAAGQVTGAESELGNYIGDVANKFGPVSLGVGMLGIFAKVGAKALEEDMEGR